MKYIDVNVFVYWLNAHPEFGETATSIIERIESGEKAVTSSLTPWLLHAAFKKTGAKGYSHSLLMERLSKIMNLHFAPLDVDVYRKASTLSDKYRLDFEDAIHLAVALDYSTDAIYSNDEDFERAPIKRVFE
ncbi:MAG: type II toxin-antitoxin system VapC family toxin [Candidatus Hydrothermarchaeales archaeon]